VWADDSTDATEIAGLSLRLRTLVGLLAAKANSPVGMTDIIDALWPAETPANVVNLIHKGIRQLLPRHAATGRPSGANSS
jgi:hypothetical protein